MVQIEDTYAEAFDCYCARVIVTSVSYKWALAAAREATGFASSLIMCPVEAGIEAKLSPDRTPDGRPGISMMFFHPDPSKLEKQLLARISQCLLTSPLTAVFDGLPDSEFRVDVGAKIRFFGDGFEYPSQLGDRYGYSIPLMTQDFFVESSFGISTGIAGGNLLILASDPYSGLLASESAVESISRIEGVITPFPGGVVGAGSKPGSLKYSFMKATTNHPYCPSLRDKIPDSKLDPQVNAVYEIIIDGLSLDAVKSAMAACIKALKRAPGVVKISAGNYGGKLGRHKIYLREL